MASDAGSLRPTKAVVLRALTDMLRPVLKDTVVLELFAGTARVGKRLLEEGSREVIGVDKRPAPEDLPRSYEWVRRDVVEFIKEPPQKQFDVIFLDPPYESEYANRLLPELASESRLVRKGIVVVETDDGTELPKEEPVDDRLYLMRRRDYGGTRLWLYQAERETPGYDG